MSKLSISKRYARALFGLTYPTGASGKVLEQLVSWQTVLGDNPDILAVMLHPEISVRSKGDMITGLDYDPEVKSFISLLINNRRLDILDEIIVEFRGLLDRAQSRAVAVITTAVPLSSDVWKEYTVELARLTGKKVEIKNEVTPEVIGGVRLQIGDKVIDETLRARLAEIKKLMTGDGSG